MSRYRLLPAPAADLQVLDPDHAEPPAINIAAGHAVTARGGDGITRPMKREPHLLLQSA